MYQKFAVFILLFFTLIAVLPSVGIAADIVYTADITPVQAGWFVSGGGSVSVNNGILDLLKPDKQHYYFNKGISELRNSVGTTIEARIKIVSGKMTYGYNPDSPYGAYIDIRDGERIAGLAINETAMQLGRNVYYMDTKSDFHTYRLTLQGGTTKAYVDGTEVLSWSAEAFTNDRGVLFAVATSSQTGEGRSLWDYVAYKTDGALSPSQYTFPSTPTPVTTTTFPQTTTTSTTTTLPQEPKLCPMVCTPLWELKNSVCTFNECGNGCGANGITTFSTKEACEIKPLSTKTCPVYIKNPCAEGEVYDDKTCSCVKKPELDMVEYSGDSLPTESTPKWKALFATGNNYVSNGILTIDSAAAEMDGYRLNWSATHYDDFTVEARIKVEYTHPEYGIVLSFADGEKRGGIFLRANAILLYNKDGNIPYYMDTTKEFHTYRLVFTQADHKTRIFVDGVERLSGTSTYGVNDRYLAFGAIVTNVGSTRSHWDYVRYWYGTSETPPEKEKDGFVSTGTFCSNPEPSTSIYAPYTATTEKFQADYNINGVQLEYTGEVCETKTEEKCDTKTEEVASCPAGDSSCICGTFEAQCEGAPVCVAWNTIGCENPDWRRQDPVCGESCIGWAPTYYTCEKTFCKKTTTTCKDITTPTKGLYRYGFGATVGVGEEKATKRYRGEFCLDLSCKNYVSNFKSSKETALPEGEHRLSLLAYMDKGVTKTPTDSGAGIYTADRLPDREGWKIVGGLETETLSLKDGVLYYRGPPSMHYIYKPIPLADNSIGTTFEAKVRAVSGSPYAARMNIGDGKKAAAIDIGVGWVRLEDRSYNMDTTGLHIYRIIMKGDVATLYVDGNEIFSATPRNFVDSTSEEYSKGVLFGRSTGQNVNSGSSEWDYVAYTTSGAFLPKDYSFSQVYSSHETKVSDYYPVVYPLFNSQLYVPTELIELDSWTDPYDFYYKKNNEDSGGIDNINAYTIDKYSSAKTAGLNRYKLDTYLVYRVLVKPDGSEQIIDKFKFNNKDWTSKQHFIGENVPAGIYEYFAEHELPENSASIQNAAQGNYRVDVRMIRIPALTAEKYPSVDIDSVVDLWDGNSYIQTEKNEGFRQASGNILEQWSYTNYGCTPTSPADYSSTGSFSFVNSKDSVCGNTGMYKIKELSCNYEYDEYQQDYYRVGGSANYGRDSQITSKNCWLEQLTKNSFHLKDLSDFIVKYYYVQNDNGISVSLEREDFETSVGERFSLEFDSEGWDINLYDNDYLSIESLTEDGIELKALKEGDTTFALNRIDGENGIIEVRVVDVEIGPAQVFSANPFVLAGGTGSDGETGEAGEGGGLGSIALGAALAGIAGLYGVVSASRGQPKIKTMVRNSLLTPLKRVVNPLFSEVNGRIKLVAKSIKESRPPGSFSNIIYRTKPDIPDYATARGSEQYISAEEAKNRPDGCSDGICTMNGHIISVSPSLTLPVFNPQQKPSPPKTYGTPIKTVSGGNWGMKSAAPVQLPQDNKVGGSVGGKFAKLLLAGPVLLGLGKPSQLPIYSNINKNTWASPHKITAEEEARYRAFDAAFLSALKAGEKENKITTSMHITYPDWYKDIHRKKTLNTIDYAKYQVVSKVSSVWGGIKGFFGNSLKSLTSGSAENFMDVNGSYMALGPAGHGLAIARPLYSKAAEKSKGIPILSQITGALSAGADFAYGFGKSLYNTGKGLFYDLPVGVYNWVTTSKDHLGDIKNASSFVGRGIAWAATHPSEAGQMVKKGAVQLWNYCTGSAMNAGECTGEIVQMLVPVGTVAKGASWTGRGTKILNTAEKVLPKAIGTIERAAPKIARAVDKAVDVKNIAGAEKALQKGRRLDDITNLRRSAENAQYPSIERGMIKMKKHWPEFMKKDGAVKDIEKARSDLEDVAKKAKNYKNAAGKDVKTDPYYYNRLAYNLRGSEAIKKGEVYGEKIGKNKYKIFYDRTGKTKVVTTEMKSPTTGKNTIKRWGSYLENEKSFNRRIRKGNIEKLSEGNIERSKHFNANGAWKAKTAVGLDKSFSVEKTSAIAASKKATLSAKKIEKTFREEYRKTLLKEFPDMKKTKISVEDITENVPLASTIDKTDFWTKFGGRVSGMTYYRKRIQGLLKEVPTGLGDLKKSETLKWFIRHELAHQASKESEIFWQKYWKLLFNENAPPMKVRNEILKDVHMGEVIADIATVDKYKKYKKFADMRYGEPFESTVERFKDTVKGRNTVLG